MSNCITCAGYLKNTGVPAGVKPFGRIVGMYLVPINADDGSVNSLDVSAFGTALDTALLGRINNADASKRFYPLLDLKNVEAPQEDATFEEDSAGTRVKVRDGRQSMTYEFWGQSRQFFKQIVGMCVPFGVILIDECGNLLGEYDEVGEKLYPREVNYASYDAKYLNTTADATSKIPVTFDFALFTSEADQVMLSISKFSAVSPLKLKGMLDLVFTITPVATGSITAQIDFIYGTVGAKIPWKGATISALTVVNETTVSSASPTSVTHNGDGNYTITYSGSSAGNKLHLEAFKAATANNENGVEGDSAQWTEL